MAAVPGHGRADRDRAAAPACGATVNFPFPAGATGDVYLAGARRGGRRRSPSASHPTWLLISAGFDAHRRDPLTDLGLTAGDFARLTARLGRARRRRAAGSCSSRAATTSRRWPTPPAPPWPRSCGVDATGPRRRRAAGPAHDVRRRRSPSAGRERPGLTGLDLACPTVVPDRFAPVLAELAPLAERFAGGRPPALPGRRDRARPAARPRARPATSTCTTDARPAEIKRHPAGLGRRGLDAGRALRHDRRPQGRPRPTRSRPTGPRPTPPTPASPTSCSPTRSRSTCRGATSRSTPWRCELDGATRRSSSIPFGGAADLAAERLRTPLRPEVSFSDDPLRMLRAARFIAGYELEPDAGAGRRRRARCATAWRSCRPSASATSSTSCIIARPTRRPGCGSSSTPAWPTSSCPSCRPCASSRTRSTATRTCWPTPSPWSRTCGPTPGPTFDFRRTRLAALFHDVGKPKTRVVPQGQGRHLPPPRGGRGPHDARPACRRCATRTTTSRPSPGWSSCTCGSTPTDGLDRLGRAPLRARRRRPARRADRADPLRLHDAQRAQGGRRWPQRMDELEARIAELAEEEELRRHPARARRHAR